MTPRRDVPPRSLLRALAGVLSLALMFCAAPAGAQLRWDASAHLGVSKRWLTERPSGALDALPGPSLQLASHVALLPLVHVGAYLGHELSPMPGEGATRHLTATGIRVKGALPFFGKAKRVWLFAGVGHAWAYAPSENAGVHGRFFEVPVGIGASYKFFDPWALSLELGARLGFGHDGSLYGPVGAPARGLDGFGAGLLLGITLAP